MVVLRRGMVNNSLKAAMLVLLGLLSACGQSDLETYYIKHPETIAVDTARCEQRMKLTQDIVENCQFLSDSWQELRTLELEARLNLDAFGQKILVSQVVLAKAQDALQLGNKQVQELQEREGQKKQLEISQEKLEQLHQQHMRAKRRVQWLLVVINLINRKEA